MKFNYKAINDQGKTIGGVVETDSKQAVLALLKKQGYRPILVNQEKRKLNATIWSSKKVKLQDLVVFSRQLSTMVSAGVPLVRSLAALQGDTESPYLKEVLVGVTKDVESGLSLAEAFSKYPTVFDEIFVSMVRAGEEGGILDDILKRLAHQIELNASLRKKIFSAMMYPTVILIVTIIAFFGIMLFIMPKISLLFVELGGPNAKLPIYSRVLVDFSHYCVSSSIIKFIPLLGSVPLLKSTPNLILISVIIGIGLIIAYRYTKKPKGKLIYHGLLLKIPVVKIIVLKIAIARFARTFSSLMSSGVNVLDALEVTGAAIGNKVIENELIAAAREVQDGKQLSEPISKSKHFPAIVSQMLMVGEETGQIDTVLPKIADFYEEEVSVLIDGLASIIEPIMIVFLGAGVGLIAASVMGPIADLTKVVGNN